VVFALCEAFIFSYVFGIERGWEEITRGADMNVPRIFRFVIQRVTPVFILLIFLGALIKPVAGWGDALSSLFAGRGWPLAPDSVFGMITHAGIDDPRWFDSNGRGTHVLVQDLTRILLCVVFATCAFLVWKAWRRKAGRQA
jgi:hypothetical protein